ncbi:hypothetical protein HZH66_008126 [Vespula vulgaris]|uniref:Uncharacterized protein n=1 Tax=Vespula vulgaris TaxID=7454 RepID=A0A834N3I7_VESVU|nr:hypothetical protein HZH66_008126 [Vespula vulgaris]
MKKKQIKISVTNVTGIIQCHQEIPQSKLFDRGRGVDIFIRKRCLQVHHFFTKRRKLDTREEPIENLFAFMQDRQKRVKAVRDVLRSSEEDSKSVRRVERRRDEEEEEEEEEEVEVVVVVVEEKDRREQQQRATAAVTEAVETRRRPFE